MYIYFFDVSVLCACACIYISCDERKASGLIRNLHRRKEVKISKISAFLSKYLTFSRKQKDVFFKKQFTHAFFFVTTLITDEQSLRDDKPEKRLLGASEEEEWLLHRHHLESARRRLLRERRGHVVSSTSWCM